MDAVITAVLLVVTVSASLTFAMRFRNEAHALDRERYAAAERCRALQQTLARAEDRHQSLVQLRRLADRYVAEVESRPVVQWTTLVGELSRRRPRGLWTKRLTGEGPRFKVLVETQRPELVSAYAQALRESSYVDFAALPAGETAGRTGQITGRLMGE